MQTAIPMIQSAAMLLAIEIGNTNITLGVWDGNAWSQTFRLRTHQGKTVDEYGIDLLTLLRETQLLDKIEKVILASVVPPLTRTFTAVVDRYLHQEALLVRFDIDLGIRVTTENPAEVGADRILNAAAAYAQYPGPSIIIDMGTATTFDVVTAAGELAGVVIAPGLKLAADALTGYAAQLRRVPLKAPPQAIGRNTTHAVQSGIILGYVGLVEGTVQRIIAEHPDRDTHKIQVIGTGGLLTLIAPHTELIDHVDAWLTLTGMRVIAERMMGEA